jgi:REP element-mobilizing transposase RayT
MLGGTKTFRGLSIKMISAQDKTPKNCLKCDTFYRSRPIRECRVCQSLEFEEGILCDLNRAIQDDHNFSCHAFRPRLRLVGPNKDSKQTGKAPVDRKSRHKSIQEIMASDKFKYQKALALQILNRDPDKIFSVIKHHLAWNVRHRKPIFYPGVDYFDTVCDIFFEAGQLVGGTAHLLWLAPDHIHLYVESDGTKSLETIAQNLKRFSKNNVLNRFPEFKEKQGSSSNIWDKAYYCETLG